MVGISLSRCGEYFGGQCWQSRNDEHIPSTKCPTCGREDFESERGVKLHHARSHGKSLAKETVECEACGEIFKDYSYRDRVTCSKDCLAGRQQEDFSEDGNPNHCGGGYVSCRVCEQEFYATPHQQQTGAVYCSRECMGKGYETRWAGDAAPHWTGRVTVNCEMCGTAVKVPPNAEEATRFCSQDCLYDWQSRTFSGESSHLWRGGSSPTDALRRVMGEHSWNKIKENERANECLICGIENSLHLHHIIPLRAGGTNGSWNLLTLCKSCHPRVERRTDDFVEPVITN